MTQSYTCPKHRRTYGPHKQCTDLVIGDDGIAGLYEKINFNRPRLPLVGQLINDSVKHGQQTSHHLTLA